MRKRTIDRFIARGGVLLIVPLLFVFGSAQRSSPIASSQIQPIHISNSFLLMDYALVEEGSCFDSDGGKDSFTAGYVEGIGPNGFQYIKSDACDGDDVKEFFCNGTIPWPVRIACDMGCLAGACLSACTDEDGDEYSPQGGNCGLVDCDDTDPAINPGMEEVCDNGIDDNCDGLTDGDDPACIVCTDNDGDGYAVEGGLCGPIDCNDENFYINPAELEVCDNGIDDDCDGALDTEDSQCLGLNTVVIGWDGVQRDHFWECYNGTLPECGQGLPNLQALGEDAIFDSVITSGGTATKPGWAQIFSGYKAEVTGIETNAIYQPLAEGYSVFEKVETHFGSNNVVTMFISGKDVHTGAACIGDETSKAGQIVIEDLGQPWCITKDFLDYYENNLRFNDVVGSRALELLELHQDDLIVAGFVFREPDVLGHLAGENSSYYSNSLIDLDRWLGLIVDKLVELGMYENTKIYVVSDHGFDEDAFRHGNAPFTFFASNDPAVIHGGDRMDIGVTILENYGISLGALGGAPAVDGYPLTLPPDWACVEEGDPFYDYAGFPACCAGLTVVNLDYPLGPGCMPATGGTGDNSGYCTNCGDGICTAPENRCNCSADCQ